VEVIIQLQEMQQRVAHAVHVRVVGSPRRALSPVSHRPSPGQLRDRGSCRPGDSGQLRHFRSPLPGDDTGQGRLGNARRVGKCALAEACRRTCTLDPCAYLSHRHGNSKRYES